MDFFTETFNKEQLVELIKEVLNETRKLEYLSKEILTFKEATAFLSLSSSTLYKLTSKKVIPFYSPGGKMIYFKKEDLEEWVYASKVEVSDKFEMEVKKYLNRYSLD